MPALEEAPPLTPPPKCAVAPRWNNLQAKTEVEIYMQDEMSGFRKVHIDDFTSL